MHTFTPPVAGSFTINLGLLHAANVSLPLPFVRTTRCVRGADALLQVTQKVLAAINSLNDVLSSPLPAADLKSFSGSLCASPPSPFLSSLHSFRVPAEGRGAALEQRWADQERRTHSRMALIRKKVPSLDLCEGSGEWAAKFEAVWPLVERAIGEGAGEDEDEDDAPEETKSGEGGEMLSPTRTTMNRWSAFEEDE